MKSIKSKILLSMMLLVSITLILVGSITVSMNYSNTLSTLDQTMTETARVAAKQVSERLDTYKTIVMEVSTNNIFMTDTNTVEDRIQLLNQKKESYGFDGAGYVDLQGNDFINKVNVADKDYFTASKNGETYITEPFVGKDKMEAIISSPIKNGEVVTGVIYFVIDGHFLSKINKEITIGKGGNSYIIDSKGITIGHPDAALVDTQDSTNEAAKKDKKLEKLAFIEREMMAGKTGFDKYYYGGEDWFLTYAPIPDSNGWSIGVNVVQDEFTGSTKRAAMTTIGVIILSLIVAFLIAIKVSNSIANPVKKCIDRISLLAEGDLKSDVPEIRSKDETGILANSTKLLVQEMHEVVDDISYVLEELSDGNLNVKSEKKYKGDFIPIQDATLKIIQSLNSTMMQIFQAANQVASGSDQVSCSAQALSQGATEQASSIEELSATVNVVSEQIKENAASAQDTSEKSISVGKELEVSNQQMQEMMDAMTEITSSSKEIEKIIKTIDDIAFQTNILALNAAVEAARAGAAGKGFAVVADEVRNLAGKSSEAAKGTTVLIEKSIQAVANGMRIASQTATSLKSVVEETKMATDAIHDISKASVEQANSINQITQGIDQISGVVQTNAATAEESAATSEELSGQAQLLNELVSKFQFDNTVEVYHDDQNEISHDLSSKKNDNFNDMQFGKY